MSFSPVYYEFTDCNSLCMLVAYVRCADVGEFMFIIVIVAVRNAPDGDWPIPLVFDPHLVAAFPALRILYIPGMRAFFDIFPTRLTCAHCALSLRSPSLRLPSTLLSLPARPAIRSIGMR